jgi:hypothetical protein
MNRAKIYRVNLDVYKRKLNIVYTVDVTAYTKRLIKRFPNLEEDDDPLEYEGNYAWALYNFNEYDTAWIVLPKGAGVAWLSHEVAHIVDELISYFGLEGTETRAYLIQHIIEHVYN